MQFDLQQALPILERTPQVIETLLYGLDDEWTENNEGGDTWSPLEIVAHLIFGEKTDWIPRVQVILGTGDKNFIPFDMEGHKKESKGKKMNRLLDEFKALYDDPAKRPLILDVRAKDAFDAGHITGAISFPESDVDARVAELPKDKLIIAYCQ